MSMPALKKNNGGSLTIADEDKNGKLTAWGGQQGAGIGGGSGKDGSNIFITGGGVNAIGGLAAAGIGGGLGGNGSNITISGGKVGATNGLNGAGIGGGQHGSGSNIIISGGEVNAIGGDWSAGIGGGQRGSGSHITISGGEVNASGGKRRGHRRRSRWQGEGITVSGNAQLKVRGGSVHGDYGTGAGIGNGGSYGTDGAEVEPDICGLNPGGKIEYYAPGSSMSGNSQQNGHQPHRRLCMGRRHGDDARHLHGKGGQDLHLHQLLPYKNRGYPRPEPQLCRAGVCFRQQRHLRTGRHQDGNVRALRHGRLHGNGHGNGHGQQARAFL